MPKIRAKNEQCRNPKHVDYIRFLLEETFGLTATDEWTWEKYVNELPEQCVSELFKLLHSDVKDVHKARAIAIIITSEHGWQPFPWAGEVASGYEVTKLYGSMFTDFSPALKKFTVQLLLYVVDITVASTWHSMLGEKFQKYLLYCYNEAILEALAKLSEDDAVAKQLFERYQYDGLPCRSSNLALEPYDPFHGILQAEISEKWKRAADRRMRKRVRSSTSVPYSLREYVRCIKYARFPYSRALIASQLTFVLGLPKESTRDLRSDNSIRDVVCLLNKLADDKKYDKLCLRLAQCVASRGMYDSKVDTTGSIHFAKAMLTRFGERDPILANQLNKLITEADKLIRESDAQYRACKDAKTRSDAISKEALERLR